MKILIKPTHVIENLFQAESVINRHESPKLSNNNIWFLFPDRQVNKALRRKKKTEANEGAAAGASTGGIVGGVLGWLIGIGSLALPGIGPFIAAGPILAALSGIAICLVVGRLSGALFGWGIPKHVPKSYQTMIKEDRILILANTNQNEKENYNQVC